MFNRKGIALPIAITACGLLILAIASLSMYSNQELRIVRKLLNLKKAEFLSMSGLQLAKAKLEKSRWYQPVGNQFVNPAANWKNSHRQSVQNEIAPDIHEAEVTLFLDEIHSYRKVKAMVKGDEYEVSTLSHINILSFAEIANESVLHYGKFILSPEPMLNSNSSLGLDSTPQDLLFEERFDSEGLISQQGSAKAKADTYILRQIVCQENQEVEANDPLMIIDAKTAAHVDVGQVNAKYAGKVVKIFPLQPGNPVKPGQTLAIIQKNYVPPSTCTLKKLVNYCRIPLSVFKSLDLGNRADRQKVYDFVKDSRESFAANLASVKRGFAPISKSFAGVRKMESLERKTVLAMLKSGNINWNNQNLEEQKIEIIKEMLENFCPGEIKSENERKKFIENNRIFLDPTRKQNKPKEMSKDIVKICTELSRWHGINYLDPKFKPLALKEYESSRGKTNLYELKSLQEYVERMNDYYNIHDQNGWLREEEKGESELQFFIRKFSQLPNAALNIKINAPKNGAYLNNHAYRATLQDPLEKKQLFGEEGQNIPFDYEKITQNDYFEVAFEEDEFALEPNGFFYKHTNPALIKVEVKDYDQLRPRYYQLFNDTLKDAKGNPFSMRIDYLMDFIAKTFDETSAKMPVDEFRGSDRPSARDVIAPISAEKYSNSGNSM